MIDVVEHLHLIDSARAVQHVAKRISMTVKHDGNIDLDLYKAMHEALSLSLAAPIFGGYRQRKALAKKLMEEPIVLPRYLTEIRAPGRFSSQADMSNKIRDIADKLEVIFHVSYPDNVFSLRSLRRSMNNRKNVKFPTAIQTLIGNTLLSLNKNSTFQDKGKLYNTVLELEEIIEEVYPIARNISTNTARVSDYSTKIVESNKLRTQIAIQLSELSNKLAELENKLKSINTTIDRKTATINRLLTLDVESSLHPDRNIRVKQMLISRQHDVQQLMQEKTTLTNEIAHIKNVQQSLLEQKKTIDAQHTSHSTSSDFLINTIRQDRENVRSGVQEISEILKDSCGLYFKRKFVYHLNNGGGGW